MSDATEHGRSDGDLLRAAMAGDESAFADFCVRALPTLTRVLRAACRANGIPEDRAEDAAQESLLRAVRQTSSDAAKAVSLGWLIRVGRNVLSDWARHDRRAESAPDDFLDDLSAEPTPPDENEELWAGMERLATAEREIIEEILFNDTSPDVLAERLHVSRWAVYKRYERALTRLREVIDARK